MKWLLALIPFVAAAPLTNVELADSPPAGSVTIEGVQAGGTGCPAGKVHAQISTDRTIMTLLFDEYYASIGPGVARTDNRKNCQINISLKYPGGFQYSILSADYRGYASIDKGVTGTLKSNYYFSGQTNDVSTTYVFKGPVSGDYLKHDEADSTSVVWSPCGANGMLNVNTQVRLEASDTKASGLLTTDSVDFNFKQVVYVQWQKC